MVGQRRQAFRDGAILMVEHEKENLSKVENLLTDGSYAGENFASRIKDIPAQR